MSDLSDKDYEDYENQEDFENYDNQEGGVEATIDENTTFDKINIEKGLNNYKAIDQLNIISLTEFNEQYSRIMIKILKALNVQNNETLTPLITIEDEINDMGTKLLQFVNSITGSSDALGDVNVTQFLETKNRDEMERMVDTTKRSEAAARSKKKKVARILRNER